MKRYICIHSHFYQPPRENPWLEEVEVQESAHPYHDWNERITAECYAANTASRILGSEKQIVDIVNNYSKISFNFGATLLSWMQKYDPKVYQAILDADLDSLKRFNGHGAAIAQVYNHMIMPLANERDMKTQVIWGIKDFEFRFKRKPEGMWLAETAVDIKTLEVLADQGIKYTILAPHQAKCIRRKGSKEWENVEGSQVNPQRAYVCSLPSGRKINLFFYDGPVSQEIAFTDLLKNGEGFAKRLLDLFPEDNKENSLVHIATDGETYGHHHRYGDMALAYCLYHIETNDLAELTNYGYYLSKHPANYDVEIVENTSWSCVHGIERWRSDCGCCIGGNEGWNQSWRAPLREALDHLRDELVPIYEEGLKSFGADPWEIRNKYIKAVLNREVKNIDAFLNLCVQKDLSKEDKIKILKLLEMQRYAMLMYTSCGWFFDEVSGLEATQLIQYAARAIQLAQEVSGVDLEDSFIGNLAKASSNMPDIENAADVYNRYVKTAKVDLLRVGAHYAISSLFENYSKEGSVYCYTVKQEVFNRYEAGKQKIVFGKAHICSNITLEESMISFCVFHFGDHNLNGGIRMHMGEDTFEVMEQEIKAAFLKSDIPSVLHLMNAHFGIHNYSLWHLFKQEQRKIFDLVFKMGLEEIEVTYRRIYKEYYPSMQARKDLNLPLPKVLENTLQFVLTRSLFECLGSEEVDVDKLSKTIDEIERWSFEMDKPALGYVASRKINGDMGRLLERPEDMKLLKSLDRLTGVVKRLHLDLDLGLAQNAFFKMGKNFYGGKQRKATQRDKDSKTWCKFFDQIGDFLQVKIS